MLDDTFDYSSLGDEQGPDRSQEQSPVSTAGLRLKSSWPTRLAAMELVTGWLRARLDRR